MSADLLAEFDSFYQAPQDTKQSKSSPASNDLSFLINTSQNGPSAQAGGGMAQWQVPASRLSEDIWGNMSSFQPSSSVPHTNAQQDDIWGSFEEAADEIKPPAQGSISTHANYVGATTAIQGQNKSGRRRTSTIDMFSNNFNDAADFTSGSTYKPSPHIKPPKPTPARKSSSGGEILFDADEISEDDDDFGDFETGVTPDPPSQPPAQSLVGLFGASKLNPKPFKRPKDLLPTSPNLDVGFLPYPQAPKSPSFQERNPFPEELRLTTNQISAIKKEDKPKSASPVTAWPTFEPTIPKPDPYHDSPVPHNQIDDDWGDFQDLPKPPTKPIAKPASGIEADAWAWDAVDGVSTSTSAPIDLPPPTNIPPPSVLLPLFQPLFDLPQSSLFKPVANQTFSLKNRILSDPSTVDFLRAYLLIATVAARIMAGRKLRWKRDTLLSQAMKIGPAAAGGKGGMKLTGVDKSEVIREDREATDVVRVWKEQLGRLRSAVAVANTSIQDASSHLVIPEISEAMHVKTQDGGLTAPKQCVICGMKREERITRVDVQVEDSFGEWWVDHWGHRACRNFWLEHESKLKHR